MASKNKQKKSNKEEKRIDSDSSSDSSDDDNNDEKYNGNEVSYIVCHPVIQRNNLQINICVSLSGHSSGVRGTKSNKW